MTKNAKLVSYDVDGNSVRSDRFYGAGVETFDLESVENAMKLGRRGKSSREDVLGYSTSLRSEAQELGKYVVSKSLGSVMVVTRRKRAK